MACKKQTAVSRSSTDAEVISLDTGLRMEGLPAVKLLDTVIDVLESHASRATGSIPKPPTRHRKPLITFHQMLKSLVIVLICLSLRTMNP